MTIINKGLIILAFIFISSAIHAKMAYVFTGSLVPEKAKAQVGRIVPLTLTLETDSPFRSVEVAIELPKGLELVKGERTSRIVDFKPGEKKKFAYKVRVKEKGEQRVFIGVNARDVAPGYGQGRTFLSIINPEKVKDTAIHTTDSDGTKVIVAPAR